MKLTIERDIFAVALSRVSPLIGKSTIPILGCLKITATPGQIEINGQNGTAAVTQTATASVADPGIVCVAADKFSALVNSLAKGSQIELDANERKLTVRYGRGHASFVTDDPASYPVMRPSEEAEPFTTDAGELRRLLTMVLPSASDERTRPYLCGTYLHADETALWAVATDGNALALGCSEVRASFKGVIVPSASCASLIRILGSVEGEAEITVSENNLGVRVGSCAFQTKLFDGTYPEYKRVIPRRVDAPVLIESGILDEVTRRAQAVTEADDKSKARPRAVILSAEGSKLRIEAGSDADQRIDEEIEIDPVPAPVKIALGTSYVIDAVAALGEGLLALHITEPTAPMVVTRDRTGDREMVVIMSRRI